ncbi:MAG: ATP-dependent zinc metalloprotease FtsH [Nitrospinaceae bacterium]|jgi:cell division protease FtsH|nr:ATP-dependent zinc metalloprotease FtsH [Nitrospinaceae bacterium]MBT4429568.1 ATP-dependent zinc metalloprotease FtsH [Nitrospinaceae bacterium]MBT5368708.1 ATP-dependent zinc metalloprotease FtsH [Nitrospinaceae bacterium]MBT5948812.1 ATP-dependent zinc metalloprotease FtsH [Nitrospinaceae bacterium]MBT6393165.1 ATP-dependent zinc metalloprotease FtsH [Nitrospinaceae bacterium]
MDQKTRFSIGYFIFILLFMSVIHSLFFQGSQFKRIPYSEFRQLVMQGQVERVDILSDRLRGEMKLLSLKGRKKYVETAKIKDAALIPMLDKAGVRYAGTFAPPWIVEFITSWILPLGILFAIYAFVLKRMGPGQGVMAFTKSKAKIYAEQEVKVRFEDVAGVDEAKEELVEVVDYLRNPGRYQRLGGKIPRGVLLVGPPGCGKTLMAKAVAGEAEVNFFSISGSEFVEMFVGLGAARVRDLFEQAVEKAPCIVFIDELDALGKSRSAGGMMGGHDEREQTLNQLLVEMDGFDTRKGVIIMAATNRPEILDAALMRPGRFDRQVLVDRPDLIGRKHILKVHAKDLVLAPDVNLDRIGEMTPGLSGADLANLANEAALLAARHEREAVTMADFEESFERVAAGLEKKSRVMTPEERRRVAFHELGHAIAAELVDGSDPVQKVSIIPRGIGALGYTLQRPTEDRFLLSKSELEDRIAVLLGGRAAEVLIFDEVSTGAQNDLQRVTDMAQAMVTEYGMTERFGPRALRTATRPLFLSGGAQTPPGMEPISEATQREVDEEVGKILDAEGARVLELLRRRRADLELLAERLLEKETISGDDLRSALGIDLGDSRVAANFSNKV